MDFLIERNFKTLKETQIDNYFCPICITRTHLNLKINGGFVSVLFIPMLPIRKDYLLSCGNCKKSIKKNSLHYIEKEKFENFYKKTSYKIPIHHFTGLSLLLSIIGFTIYIGIQATKEERIRIQKPTIDDIYRIKNENGYTTFKVNKIYNDSVSVFLNDIYIDNYDQIEDIDISKNYNKSRLFSKQELLNMFDTNKIYQVDSKESY